MSLLYPESITMTHSRFGPDLFKTVAVHKIKETDIFRCITRVMLASVGVSRRCVSLCVSVCHTPGLASRALRTCARVCPCVRTYIRTYRWTDE